MKIFHKKIYITHVLFITGDVKNICDLKEVLF